MKPTYYITTPIYYVNDRPHLGHIYTTVVADVIARYRRLMGDDVRFLTGTDEHGQKMERSAARRGIREIDLADEVVKNYLELYPRLGVTHDDFIRTTEPRHHRAVKKIFQLMQARGDISLGAYEGWYCTGCEAFIPESQIREARCELGHPVERMKEESYFFRLSAYQDRLLELYRSCEDAGRPFVQPRTRMNEVRSFVQGGLTDLSISRRSVRWGIPVPGDPQHVIYVWLDALTNYVSALGFGGEDSSLYSRYWEGGEARSVIHLVGKEIVRFHAVYWPAFLMSAGLPLPTTVYSHGWWLFDNEKMSKSIGNIVRPGPLLDAVGADPLRYFLLREMSFGSDGSYTNSALVERLNGDLANGLGNLVSRVVTLLEKEAAGAVPGSGHETDATRALGEAARLAYAGYAQAFDRYAFSEGLGAIFGFVAEVNRFLVREEPWRLAKDPSARATLAAVLRACAEAVRTIALWIAPVMPGASAQALKQLGLPPSAEPGSLADWAWGAIPGGAGVVRGPALFPRADREQILARIETSSLQETAMLEDDRPSASPSPRSDSEEAGGPRAGAPPGSRPRDERLSANTRDAPSPAPAGAAKPESSASAPEGVVIDIDQFMEVELRTARVESAERVPKADKLLRLIVDLGTEKRQVVAGIAASYSPEELVGKTIVVVANLQPAKLRGIVSQGMLLAADAGEGAIIVTLDRDVAPGTRVR